MPNKHKKLFRFGENKFNMIQRIQSVFLLLAAILGGLYLYSPIVAFVSPNGSYGWYRAYELKYFVQGYWVFVAAIAAGISIGVNLVSIFLYKFPSIQKLFSVLSILNMLFCFGYAYHFWSGGDFKEDTIFYYGNITPWIIITLNLLAIRGVVKDENLLKSYDRLR
jgi:hypothetical protein